MATSRVVSGQPLPDSAVRSQAPALAVVARAITGHNREVYELATGENPTPREAAATRRNPQGLLGHDHSGPPWGSTFRHPIAWCTGRQPSSDIRGERQVVDGLLSTNARRLPPWVFWCPPFARLPSPYAAPRSRLYLFLLAKSVAGTPSVNVTISSHEDYDPDPDTHSHAFSLTSTLTGYSHFALSMHARPGYNRADISFESDDPTNESTIVAMSLCVIRKR